MDSVSERELKSLILELQIVDWKNSYKVTKLITQGVSLINSVDLEVTSLTTLTISLFKTVDFDSQSKPLTEFVSLISQTISVVNSTNLESELMPLLEEIWNLKPKTEVRSLIKQIINDVVYTSIESELIERISRLINIAWYYSDFMSLFKEIISLIGLIDLESNPKPESELMSLIIQTISLYNSISMDLQSQPKPMIDLLSFIVSQLRSYQAWFSEEFDSLVEETSRLEPEPELMSLIHQIITLVNSKTLKKENLIIVTPVQVTLEEGRFCVDEQYYSKNKWDCLVPGGWRKIKLTREDEDATYFLCRYCNGENHKEYNKLPVQVKHTLHQKHSLQLVFFYELTITRKCYCCGDILLQFFYCCLVCDCAMNITCLEKSPLTSIDYPKWHKHPLTLFPRKSSLTCDLCALSDSSCPFYICPPCDFVTHQSCISLPRVIKISRHSHRIKFTPTFEQGDWSCGICRTKINNDYGGYSCYKDSCLYGAHSKCATQSNVWDGIDLEGVPEEKEEILEPFERISDGVIKHFSHPEHHLRLDENTKRDYNEYKQCQACTMPIYFGNLYSCMQCDFILHEKCANLSRRIHHPIHQHILTLVTNYDGEKICCSACDERCTSFFYLCSKEGCKFRLHVQCATISEPLVHGSHIHPLYLTSKPQEERRCSVCEESWKETWNCIESECAFSLCFRCAVVPQKVRYKHDKHMFSLCYGDITSTMASWCEICESKIDPKKRFYMCDEDCCVTLHIECLIGKDLYMKPGWSWLDLGYRILVVPNNHQTRPICNFCKKRCSQKVAFFHESEMILCSTHLY